MAETLANVINTEPVWAALPIAAPTHVRQTPETTAPVAASRPAAPFARVIPWAVVALLALALLVTQIVSSRPTVLPSPRVVRLELNMPAGVEVGGANTPTYRCRLMGRA